MDGRRTNLPSGSEASVETLDDDRSATVASAIRATGSPMADDTVERVGTRLDRYAAAWVAMRTESCEATHVRGDQSEAMLDLRSACLDDRLRHVSDLVDVLAEADTEVVERAVSAVAELPGLELCTDIVGQRSGLTPPADPEVASATERLRASMGRARALMSAGRFEPARSLALEARSEATVLG